MHLVHSRCAVICELHMLGTTIFQVSSQTSVTNTVNLKVLSHYFNVGEM